MRKLVLVTLCIVFGAKAVSPSHFTYQGKRVMPLGIVRVTRYTHHEGGRLTASGHILEDADTGIVCAVGRDWYKKYITPGDVVWIEGFARPCTVFDTMAIYNHKGLRQTHWVDVYDTDVTHALDFGIQRRTAYLVR